MESLAWELQKCLFFDVYQFTLPGHAQKTNIKYDDWIKSVEEKVETLIDYGYSSIYVVGHSMGGVLASYVATKYSEIKKVVLAAPSFKYIGDKDNFSFRKAGLIINDYGIAEVLFRGFERLPVTALNEFVMLVSKYQDVISKIKSPILVFQGLNDNVVPKESSEYVINNVMSKKKGIVYLKKSNHDIFRGSQKEIVNQKIRKFLISSRIEQEEEYI